jgi:two-component system, chemotaxis family, CheB/CheR fusion protein
MPAQPFDDQAPVPPAGHAEDKAGSTPAKRDLLVVGIGASAGGLEAFSQLLSHLPGDTGMAVVLIQHLDPSQDSLLSDLIARITPMPVQAVTDDMPVAPNQVYVIPPNASMTLRDGQLRLRSRDAIRQVYKPIDAFFESLASELGPNAIGVVLSGGNSDGTLGLEAIKAAGGITFAQSEDSAKVTSMPHMAIATGQVDFVQPPSEIAATLTRLSRHPYLGRAVVDDLFEGKAENKAENAEGVSEAATLDIIFDLLRAASQIDFRLYKPTTIKRRILRRMSLHHIGQFDRYRQYLQETPTEVQALYQEILIGVTSFFRDAGAFDCLKREVFPALMRDGSWLTAQGQSPSAVPLRLWIAGCSTGEEAYSIAICLLEFLAHQPYRPPIQIFATDVSEQAIEIARQGIYLPAKVADVSADRLQRFFVPVEGGYQINKAVRELCVFARQDLICDPPFSRLDLISCRNVLIYIDSALQKKVLPMFHYGLKPGGFLMLSSSETVGEFTDLFALLDRQHKIYAKQSSSLRLNFVLPTPSADRSIAAPPQTYLEPRPAPDIYNAADQVVLDRYGPVGVVVNSQLNILQFRGQTRAYLEPAPGRASLNLLTMAKDSLRLDLRTALYEAKQLGQPVRKAGVLPEGAGVCPVVIEVLPFQPNAEGETYFLVLFEAISEDSKAEDAAMGSASPLAEPDRQELLHLRQELETTKRHLQSIIEEQESTNQDLRAANEEILSSNEELQSTNEELQTAKEEIQATNEELSTINDELYSRNAETTRISNDFQNLLGSINIPILMLAGDLSIRRFTPTAAALFNLIPSDIGRPFSDINHRLTITNLEEQILAVISTLNQHSQEVQDRSGHWYDLRIRPYRTLDDRIDGAVLVLVDIDILKSSAEQLRQARDYAEAIVEMVQDSMLVLDADLRVVRANSQFYAVFQVLRQETEGCPIFDLGNGQWNIAELRSLLQDLLPHNSQIENFRVEHVFDHIGLKVMRLNARQILTTTGSPLILLTIQDMSDRPNERPDVSD